MKYAIISDIHGNVFALEAVLKDAKEQDADAYLFLGDYCVYLPWANQVLDLLRHQEKATIISGNGDRNLVELQSQDPATWTSKQFMPTYWHYRNLAPENLAFLLSLPQTATVSEATTQIHVAHSSSIFLGSRRLRPFHSSDFRRMMEEKKFDHEEYLNIGREAVLAHPELIAEMEALPSGTYLFGHNHLQFHMEFGDKLFLNPGSCGAPLDCNPAASYTLLNLSAHGREIDERKVVYDYVSVAEQLRQSPFAAEMPVWAELLAYQLLDGKDYGGHLFSHLREICVKMGMPVVNPVCNEVWDEAMRTWDVNRYRSQDEASE